MPTHYACVGVFKYCLGKIRPGKIASLEDKIESLDVWKVYKNRDERVYIVLANDFENKARKLIDNYLVTETDVEAIAKQLCEEYFV